MSDVWGSLPHRGLTRAQRSGRGTRLRPEQLPGGAREDPRAHCGVWLATNVGCENRGSRHRWQRARLILPGHLSLAAAMTGKNPALLPRQSASFTVSPVPPGWINRGPRGGLEQKVTVPRDSLSFQHSASEVSPGLVTSQRDLDTAVVCLGSVPHTRPAG